MIAHLIVIPSSVSIILIFFEFIFLLSEDSKQINKL